MKFPLEHKFTKLSLLRRGPSSVLQMINKAKNIEELKKNFKEFSDRDRRRIEQKTKKYSQKMKIGFYIDKLQYLELLRSGLLLN